MKNTNDTENSGQDLQDVKDLVIARIKTMPENLKVSVGSEGDFSKNELIDHIQKGDPVGNKIIESELKFIQDLKEGKIYEQIHSCSEA